MEGKYRFFSFMLAVTLSVIWGSAVVPVQAAQDTLQQQENKEVTEMTVSANIPLIDYVDYVDPFIGTDGGWSNTTVGPQLPNGSVNPGPDTPNGSHDGYDYQSDIIGFSQLHVNGAGYGKYGQFLISPQMGLDVTPEGHTSPKSNEKAKAYEYGVTLTKYDIDVRFTPEHHSTIYEFTFPQSSEPNQATLLFDIAHNVPQYIAQIGGTAKNLSATVSITDTGTVVSGKGTFSGGFGDGEYTVHYYCEINQPAVAYGTFLDQRIMNGQDSIFIASADTPAGVYLQFDSRTENKVMAKVGISFKSIEQAEKWLTEEIPDWNYIAVKQQAINLWNDRLSKIRVKSEDKEALTIFYTCLFRSQLMPRDRTNDYAVYKDAPMWDDHYATWDTFRTVYPLNILIYPEMVTETIQSYLTRFAANGMVHDTFVAGQETWTEQGGNNIDNIIAEAYVKGVQGIDWEQAYALLKYNAENERHGWQGWEKPNALDSNMASYQNNGYIPAGIMSCSYTLEYAYNDYCTAQVAKGLGKTEDYQKYLERSHQWTHLFNPDLESDGFKGFIAPRQTDGRFVPIDPKQQWGSWNQYFYEGNSWTYSFFMPHDIEKLIALCGGKDPFEARLKYGLEQDLIDFGNEPAFLSPFLFAYTDHPELISEYTRRLMQRYTLSAYPGNDDAGTMSAWYIFASLGFFPNAGQDIYYLLAPSFEECAVTLANGKEIILRVKNFSPENTRIASISINGQPYDSYIIHHAQIAEGALIEFTMA